MEASAQARGSVRSERRQWVERRYPRQRVERRRIPERRGRDAIRGYWNEHPHGAEYTDVAGDWATPAFFARIRPWMSPYRFPWILQRIERESAGLQGKHLLDLGCGLGYDSVEFLSRGVRVTAVDISASAVSLARQHLAIEGVEAEALDVANALDLPYADESFDAVWSDGVLYYTGNMPRALREVWRVLKPGGRAIISHLRRRPSWIELLSRVGHEPVETKGEEPPVSEAHTEEEILAMFAAFDVVETTRDQFRARPVARRGWKAALYRCGFRPVFNAIPRPLAEHLASKLSVTAVKPALRGPFLLK